MTAKVKTFKSHQILVLDDGIASLIFGLNKALLVIEHLEQIKAFIASGGTSVDPEVTDAS